MGGVLGTSQRAVLPALQAHEKGRALLVQYSTDAL